VLDKNFYIRFINEELKANYQAQGMEIEEGVPLSKIFTDEETLNKYKAYYERALQGEQFKVIEKIDHLGDEIQANQYELSYMPIENKMGEIIGVASRGTLIS
jgi:hypothetical protein